jgi:GNAT superfamily N-acetyltransferase
MTIKRTDSKNADFIRLVRDLDVYLTEKDGDEHGFYDQYNKLGPIQHVLVVYENDTAVSCGGFKEFGPGVVEIKRMYTAPSSRGKGYASMVLEGLEKWAEELGYSKAILETGKRQEEAVQFYPKNGYRLIPNYGQYESVENSLCFEKDLN